MDVKIDIDKQIKRLKDIGVDEYKAKSYLYDLERDLKKENKITKTNGGTNNMKNSDLWQWFIKQPGRRKAMIIGGIFTMIYWIYLVYK
jgi:hypothetical protein